MREKAAALCHATAPRANVAELAKFEPKEGADYTNVDATLSACGVLASNSKCEALLGNATEHLYQLNNVYVQPPTKTDSICTGSDNRLWALLDCWDFSHKITLGFRAKTMLQLAQLPETGSQLYEDQHACGALRHPVLASLRVRIKKKKR